MPRARHVLVLAVEDCQSLDLFGPVEVFQHACLEVPDAYVVEVVGPTDNGLITMQNGLRLSVAPLPEPPLHDTLVVAGGSGTVTAAEDPAIVDWVLRASRRSRRTASVCTGAFLLAAAGLLDDRRATTHWAFSDELARRYPRVDVDPDPVFIHEGEVWTSAGITAGIDLALALVEEDLGPAVALAVARALAARRSSAVRSQPSRPRARSSAIFKPGSPGTSTRTSPSRCSPSAR
jgi:transcriptional regulator GlxA family with amidase domain